MKLSDALVLDAQLTGKIARRSIAGQIEFRAGLGRAVETLLRGDQVMALAKAGKARPLSDCLRAVDTPAGRKRLLERLKSLPYPHYEPAPGGLLVKIEANGRHATGRFVNKKFQPVKLAGK